MVVMVVVIVAAAAAAVVVVVVVVFEQHSPRLGQLTPKTTQTVPARRAAATSVAAGEDPATSGFLVVDPGDGPATARGAGGDLVVNDQAGLMFDSLVRAEDAEIAERMKVRD